MSFQGVLEAKLCWSKNIQVQIESPLLPMALMPIEPLEHYDDVYDFLEPDFVPPIVSLIEKVRYWYQERARGKARMKALMEAQRR